MTSQNLIYAENYVHIHDHYDMKSRSSVSERYGKAMDSWTHLLIYKFALYNNDVRLKIQRRCQRVSIQTNDQRFAGMDPIFFIDDFT